MCTTNLDADAHDDQVLSSKNASFTDLDAILKPALLPKANMRIVKFIYTNLYFVEPV